MAGVRIEAFRCDDPHAAAWRVLSLLDGLALQTVAHGSIIDRDTAIDWSMVATELELGLQPGAAAPARSNRPRLRPVLTRTESR